MLARMFGVLSSAVESSPLTALSASFIWGCLSILLSPCHLASIPLIIGFLTDRGVTSIRRAFTITLIFSIGILITIGIIGGVTAALGRMLGDIGKWGNYALGGIFFIIAFYLLEVIRLPWSGLMPDRVKKRGYTGALVMGFLFGFALGPCTFAYLAPVLGVVFRVSSVNTFYSIALLSSYAVGHCLFIVAAGTFYGRMKKYLNWISDSKSVKIVKSVCASLLFLAGGWLVYTSINV
ncbi:MAG: cytochrome C biogenesis protein [Spirochaetota bacterium]|nr:MAG: cytochrome C biogenesis protein [Spirochaetota bacterium]